MDVFIWFILFIQNDYLDNNENSDDVLLKIQMSSSCVLRGSLLQTLEVFNIISLCILVFMLFLLKCNILALQ